MNITVRNHTLLRLCGFTPYHESAHVSLPVRMWLDCFWYRLTSNRFRGE